MGSAMKYLAYMLGGTILGGIIGGVVLITSSPSYNGIQASDCIAPIICGTFGLLFGTLVAAATNK
jgi:hypothetical protein